jgi:small GTP-binding protein
MLYFFPMEGILDPRQADLLRRTRDVLGVLREVLATTSTTAEDRAALVDSVRQLDDLFLLVVAGEFNSGKSAFINALLGREVLPEGVTPTTAQIHVLRHGDEPGQRQIERGVWEQTAPDDILREIVIVDTPGTNAILREHEALTAAFIPRSDLVLFVTSADRPFTESERAFLVGIRDWGKKIVLVVNKIDILSTDAERAQVLTFVTESSQRLIGELQAIFPVSARLAKAAKSGRPELWPQSGFGPLEAFIHETLDDAGRFRLKLLSPLGVGLRLVRQQIAESDADLGSLAADRVRLDDIEAQTREYATDMQRGFQARLAEIDNILLGMEKRGNTFFDEMIRFGRIPDLLRAKGTELAFEHEVVADVPGQIDTRVTELIDWMVTQDLRQWSAVADHMARGTQAREDRIVGEAGPREGTLAYDRQRLIDSIGKASRMTVETYDETTEAAEIAETARQAVVDTGLAGVGVGIGVAIAVAAHVVWLDVTGIVTGVLAAALGLLILPARRRKAKAGLQAKLADLRERLVSALSDAFDREMRRGTGRIDDTVAPFARFVRAETEKITTRRERLGVIETDILGLQGELEKAG